MKSGDFIAKKDCGRLRAPFGHTGGREEFFRRTRRRKNDLIFSRRPRRELCEASNSRAGSAGVFLQNFLYKPYNTMYNLHVVFK